eukprot:5745411-Pleurochrysis_carterae.AAC.1
MATQHVCSRRRRRACKRGRGSKRGCARGRGRGRAQGVGTKFAPACEMGVVVCVDHGVGMGTRPSEPRVHARRDAEGDACLPLRSFVTTQISARDRAENEASSPEDHPTACN